MVPELSSTQWRDDLDYLVERLPRTHRHLHHTISPHAFDRSVRRLHARIPALAAHEVIVELARLVASIADGHTSLRLPDIPGLRRYPIVPYLFSDGLHVRAIDPDHAFAAGARLIGVGDTPIDEVLAVLRPLISRDNEMGVIAVAPVLLSIPEVMHACGLVDDMERASFTIQLPDGTRPSLSIDAVPEMPADLADARDGATSPAPLWLQRPATENWYTTIAGTDILYVGLNRIRDGEREPLHMFFDRIFETIERNAVDRLVLDIRLNHGGNNLLNQSLIHRLVRCDRVNRWGGLFAIIGRLTFSAAMNLATDLERHTRVLFVGEPTGSTPNHYGETGSIVLPASGLDISVSSLWWQPSMPFDDRAWITPDIPARLSSRDYAANHDPAVAACLRHEHGAVPPLGYPDRVFAALRLDESRLGSAEHA